MIDYIPADIPKPVIEYVDTHFYYNQQEDKYKWFKYLAAWNDLEVYAYTTANRSIPVIILYDCNNARIPSKEEHKSVNYIRAKYFSSYIKEPHLCHLEKKAYRRHTKPNDYKKIKHITPKYIPTTVIEKIDSLNLDSYHPGFSTRKIRYLKTENNKYEVYVFYWENTFPRRRSFYRPLLYDCIKVRRPGLGEFPDLENTNNYKFSVFLRPNLCTSD